MLIENEKEIKDSVSKVLDLTGIPSNRLGYKYIVHAVSLIHMEGKNKKIQIMKVYDQLSNEFDKTAYSVEKAIRKSIDACVIDGNIPELNKIFSKIILDETVEITNKKFISLLVEELVLTLLDLTKFRINNKMKGMKKL